MKIKSLFIVSAIILLGLISCKKDPTPMVTRNITGTITGLDFRKCMCCGGWFVDAGDSTYRFYDIPKSSGLDLSNEILPLDVSINFTQENDRCMPDLIIVNKIKKR